MIKKTSSNQPCGRDSEYITGAFLKSFSIGVLFRFEKASERTRLIPLYATATDLQAYQSDKPTMSENL